MNIKKVTIYFSGLILLAALMRWPTYTFPFRTIGAVNYWSTESVIGNILSLAFLIFPVLAFLGFIRGWRTAYIWLAISPIVFFLFGSTPIPFGSYLYSDNHVANTVAIGVVDATAVVLAIWLYLYNKKHSNNQHQPTGVNTVG